jgi:hypothetical protein
MKLVESISLAYPHPPLAAKKTRLFKGCWCFVQVACNENQSGFFAFHK